MAKNIFLFSSKVGYFQKCAEEESLSAAAIRIGISQSALSTAIKSLEAELGLSLFERHADGISLTPQGRVLLTNLKNYQKQMDRELSPQLYKASEIPLRIGSVSHFYFKYLRQSLANISAKIPLPQIALDRSLRLFESVENSDLDFAFVSWTNTPKKLSAHSIRRDPVAIVGNKKYFPMLENARSVKELEKLPWVYQPKPQYDYSDIFLNSGARFIASDIHESMRLILLGQAIGEVQLDGFSENELANLCKTSFPSPHANVQIYLVHKPDASKELRERIELILEIVRREAN